MAEEEDSRPKPVPVRILRRSDSGMRPAPDRVGGEARRVGGRRSGAQAPAGCDAPGRRLPRPAGARAGAAAGGAPVGGADAGSAPAAALCLEAESAPAAPLGARAASGTSRG